MMTHKEKNNLALQQTQRVVFYTIIINITNTILKLIVGIMFSSMALIADGLHSLSDLVTDMAVIIGARIGAKKTDKDHPYGHGWAETFATLFISVLLALAGVYMIERSIESIALRNVSHIGIPVFVVALISIATKEFAFLITKRVAVKYSSSMLYANAWHHRSDALSSVAVAVGAVASMFGFDYGDQAAATVVGIMIIIVAVKIFADAFGQFTARAVDTKTNEQITKIIASQSQIRQWHKLRTRTVGRELFMDLHILVDPQLSITDAHNISEMLENELHQQIAQPVNITVHIEPDEDRPA
ncbi:MAG: cation diffusion facilitator family transporter [Phycisphaerae bacterium]|nr:cation diffusion facilitator family transporter [Phycisphaerae bacterium]